MMRHRLLVGDTDRVGEWSREITFDFGDTAAHCLLHWSYAEGYSIELDEVSGEREEEVVRHLVGMTDEDLYDLDSRTLACREANLRNATSDKLADSFEGDEGAVL